MTARPAVCRVTLHVGTTRGATASAGARIATGAAVLRVNSRIHALTRAAIGEISEGAVVAAGPAVGGVGGGIGALAEVAASARAHGAARVAVLRIKGRIHTPARATVGEVGEQAGITAGPAVQHIGVGVDTLVRAALPALAVPILIAGLSGGSVWRGGRQDAPRRHDDRKTTGHAYHSVRSGRTIAEVSDSHGETVCPSVVSEVSLVPFHPEAGVGPVRFPGGGPAPGRQQSE